MCLGADCEGAFAEYLAVPDRNCLPVPDGLSDDLAAVATDSVATAYHAVAYRGGVTEGSRVVVWGTGGLGLSAVGIARTLGASRVIAVDARAEARQWALETGADEALEPEGALEKIGRMGGMDVALEFVGKTITAESAVRSLDHGGRAVVVGVGFETLSAGRLMTFVLREREVVGSYGSEPHEVATCLDLMASGKLVLPRVVGDTIPLSDVLSGLSRVQSGDTGGSRIVVDVTTGWSRMSSGRPLEGVRVLDLTRLLPGGVLGALLADLGADVVKVEEPKLGDYMRWEPLKTGPESAASWIVGRGKRSFAVDLKSPEGVDVFLKLVESADIVHRGLPPRRRRPARRRLRRRPRAQPEDRLRLPDGVRQRRTDARTRPATTSTTSPTPACSA